MGLLQKAVETYNCHASLAGVIRENKTVLAPVSHLVTSADLEITIDSAGAFVTARAVEKTEPKILIPATEGSAGRTAAPCAHPLCEQLGYLIPQNEEKYALYVQQLENWCNSENSHEKLKPILTYVKGTTILRDLADSGLIQLNSSGMPEKEKLLVRWRVLGCGEPSACWEDRSLMLSFIQWYDSVRKDDLHDLCMITGINDVFAEQHAKGIVPISGNAKLISSNDNSGFTFRGRFISGRQSASIGYEASQKAHNALRWLIAEEGVVIGGRTFICWTPQGNKVPGIAGPFMRSSAVKTLPSDYRKALLDTLIGYQSELPEKEGVVIAAFDAATTGRLAVTYYNELQGSDFLDRLYNWDLHCCWKNGRFGIQSPSLYQIARNAFGVPRSSAGRMKMDVDDRILKQQIQRLIASRVDRARIPHDIVASLVQRASNPIAYDADLWNDLLFTVNAVLSKFIFDYKGDDIMSWELDKPERSFQFGRLLAVMDRAERDFYGRTGEERQSNALKAMSAFRHHPWHVYEQVNRQLQTAYLPRIEAWQRKRYEKLTGEIISILRTFPENELNTRLDDTYLLGYDLQRNDFFKSTKTNETEE